MALVAYGSSDSGSDSEEEEGGPTISLNGEVVAAPATKPPAVAAKPPVAKPAGKSPTVETGKLPPPRIKDPAKQDVDLNISDEEDDIVLGNGNFIDDYQEPDLLSLISKKLPLSKLKSLNPRALAETEDTVPVQYKKIDYGTKIEEPPAKKKKRDGPVRISIPSLKELKSLEEEEEESKPVPRVTASKTGSGLFALLPEPKNKMVRSRPINVAVPETGEERIKGGPALTEGVRNNLKPTGARKSGLIPHIIAKPVPASSPPPSASSSSASLPTAAKHTPVDDSDSEGEDFMGLNSGSYFPEPEAVKPNGPFNPAPSSEYIYGLKKPPPPRLPVDTSYVPLDTTPDELGPAIAPYPPVAPYSRLPEVASIDDEAAIARLAGKAAKRREFEDMKIIDINEDDMRGDPNVWLTKAMTEEQAPAPNRKGPKGLAKTRHQITYLAHQAKERDFELRQEWSEARANKRASMNKYGFI